MVTEFAIATSSSRKRLSLARLYDIGLPVSTWLRRTKPSPSSTAKADATSPDGDDHSDTDSDRNLHANA